MKFMLSYSLAFKMHNCSESEQRRFETMGPARMPHSRRAKGRV